MTDTDIVPKKHYKLVNQEDRGIALRENELVLTDSAGQHGEVFTFLEHGDGYLISVVSQESKGFWATGGYDRLNPDRSSIHLTEVDAASTWSLREEDGHLQINLTTGDGMFPRSVAKREKSPKLAVPAGISGDFEFCVFKAVPAE